MNDNNVIKQLYSGNKISIIPIVGRGTVNRVYLVSANENSVIIRLNSKEELARFQKEAWCLEQASAVDVPSPNLIDIGVVKDTAYMILSYIEGRNGVDIVENKPKVWRVIGSYAKKINSMTTNGFGESMVSPGVFADNWERYLNYNIDSLDSNDKLLEIKAITREQSSIIKERFVKLKDKKFEFGLIHGDLSLENVIVEDVKVTLIDWGVAEATIVPHMEIVDLLQNQLSDDSPLFDEFLGGYGMSREKYELIRPEIKALALLQAMDKLRWAVDKKPDQITEFAQIVQTILKRQ